MHYRIFSLFVAFICLFGCAMTTAAQEQQDSTATAGEQNEKPVILYSGQPKKYEIADIKIEGAKNYEDYVIIGLSGLSKGQVITIPGAERFGAYRSVCLSCVMLLTGRLACVSLHAGTL